MNHKDVLIDLLDYFSYGLHRTLADLSTETLQWQPDPQANNIAVTVWHICRALDMLKVKIIEDKPVQDQLWYANDWAAKTGYSPAGLGFGGFGNLAGYTLDQVKDVPLLSAGELLEYFDQVYESLCDFLKNMEVDALEEAPPGWPSEVGEYGPECIYDLFLMFLMDNREHLGEIKAIRAMWARKYEDFSL